MLVLLIMQVSVVKHEQKPIVHSRQMQFRQRRGKVWEPQVVLEPDDVQERMRKTIDYMIQHATFQRDQVILLLLRQTGARLSEIIEMTAGGYRAATRIQVVRW